eukprot:TRINITY_DN33086_c0_g1_i1.p1 TRINITY_DN33086_c0_g1~~TRINITY_DN33086_c0_g1_i1.p1  ORF type:complete len:367 (-),score=56.31 TRINITY_DN33086_c0_g1_i1:101-1147(-)
MPPSVNNVGNQNEGSAGFDKHRFDNYGGWLDREERLKAQSDGRNLGWGYANKRAPAQPQPEKPFSVLEPSFTSGELVTRKYEQIQSPFKCETNRSDLHHYPNYMNIKEEHHYSDHRRRSCNPDPTRWKPLPGDKALNDAVTDDMVRLRLAAEKGENRRHIDPKYLELLNSDVRLDAASVRELDKEQRVDLSCANLPQRERPDKRLADSRRSTPSSPANARSGWALSGNPNPPPPLNQDGSSRGMPPSPKNKGTSAADGKWGWCISPQPAPALGAVSAKEQSLIMSRSLPVMLPGNSLLIGNAGNATSSFHGVTTRKFGGDRWNGRMRGGSLAQQGWAGTFPEKEKRAG